MKKSMSSRRKFIRNISLGGIAFANVTNLSSLSEKVTRENKKRIGIIGLDTSHSIEFTKTLNNPNAGPEFAGYKVVLAYPHGSADIESSTKRIPAYTEEIKTYGVKIAGSIKELLDNYVRPAVEMDGGAIQFKSYDAGVVNLMLQGSCSGCPSSMITLKAGIEGMMKRMIPEVKEVVAEAE